MLKKLTSLKYLDLGSNRLIGTTRERQAVHGLLLCSAPVRALLTTSAHHPLSADNCLARGFVPSSGRQVHGIITRILRLLLLHPGSIPPWIGSLSALTYLSLLYGNEFTGEPVCASDTVLLSSCRQGSR